MIRTETFLSDSQSPLVERREEKFKTGWLRLIGVPATIVDSKNGNGRTYSTKVIEKALGTLKKNKAFENKKMLCAADDHPKESYVPPIRASHVVTNAYLKEIDGKKHLLNDWFASTPTTARI